MARSADDLPSPPLSANALLAAGEERLLYLTHASTAGSSWRFLDQLGGIVPNEACSLVYQIDVAIEAVDSEAARQRERGMLGHSMELRREVEAMCRQRLEVLGPFARSPLERPQGATGVDVASVASALHSQHYCVLDDFSPGFQPLLQAMLASGELQPGEVSAGSDRRSRGDVMCWLGGAAGRRSPQLARLLSSLDTLVESLCRSPLLSADLAAVRLVRHEIQERVLTRCAALGTLGAGRRAASTARPACGLLPLPRPIRTPRPCLLLRDSSPPLVGAGHVLPGRRRALRQARGRCTRRPRPHPHVHLLLQPSVGGRRRRRAAAARGAQARGRGAARWPAASVLVRRACAS